MQQQHLQQHGQQAPSQHTDSTTREANDRMRVAFDRDQRRMPVLAPSFFFYLLGQLYVYIEYQLTRISLGVLLTV